MKRHARDDEADGNDEGSGAAWVVLAAVTLMLAPFAWILSLVSKR